VLSYNYISPTGGNNSLWSEIPSQSSFQDHEAPFPIIIITQTNVANGTCRPNTESAVWEVSPFEFGSFDANVNAFYPTQYMGTSGDGNSSQCTTGFDNVGFITGISSNILVPVSRFDVLLSS
jgi:lysophospholipase